MIDKKWLSAAETQEALAGISKSTLRRRTKDLKLLEHGLALKLGRRLLYSAKLPDLLPSLVAESSKISITGAVENV